MRTGKPFRAEFMCLAQRLESLADCRIVRIARGERLSGLQGSSKFGVAWVGFAALDGRERGHECLCCLHSLAMGRRLGAGRAHRSESKRNSACDEADRSRDKATRRKRVAPRKGLRRARSRKRRRGAGGLAATGRCARKRRRSSARALASV